MYRDAKNIATCILLVLLLASCSYNPLINNNHTTGNPAGAIVGAAAGAGGVAALGGPKPVIALAGLGGGALGYYVTTLRYDSSGVIQSGGKVYRVGDMVGIYLPTDKLFEPNTADFLPQASPILDSTAMVLKRYPSNSIIISGNTSGFGQQRRELKLSQERAKKVASYLWNAGINYFKGASTSTRKLNYVGYGDYFRIANDYTNKGIRANSRIQITSYPTDCDIGIDKRHAVMNNMGEFKG